MKCFTHSNVDAVALCKSCGRALCLECVTEVGLSCSCKGRSETVVATMDDLIERGLTAYLKSSATQMRNGILIILLGVLFVLFSLPTGARSPFFSSSGLAHSSWCSVYRAS